MNIKSIHKANQTFTENNKMLGLQVGCHAHTTPFSIFVQQALYLLSHPLTPDLLIWHLHAVEWWLETIVFVFHKKTLYFYKSRALCMYDRTTTDHHMQQSWFWARVASQCRVLLSYVSKQGCSDVPQCNMDKRCSNTLNSFWIWVLNQILVIVCSEPFDCY